MIDIFLNDAIAYASSRLIKEEEFRQYVYDDATGERVVAPKGHVTWLIGINTETEGCLELAELVLKWKLSKLYSQLSVFSWFVMSNSARASVLLDIAFNAGVDGLLGFHRMIAAIEIQDWPEAKAQCMVKNPKLKERYERLGQILEDGVINQ